MVLRMDAHLCPVCFLKRRMFGFPFSSKVSSNVSEKLQKVDNSLACIFSLWLWFPYGMLAVIREEMILLFLDMLNV